MGHRYVEDFGLLFERSGLSGMARRVLGALVSEESERSAEELAGTLQASRVHKHHHADARANQANREGQQTGRAPDHFRNKRGTWRDVMRRELELVSMMPWMAEEGIKILKSSDPKVRCGLKEMLDIYASMEKELPAAIFARWEKEVGEGAQW